MPANRSRLPSFFVVTLGLVFVLVVWGGIVRLSGSGLAIPDWPLAHGGVLPKQETRVMIEYIHRVLAMTVGVFTLGLAIAVYAIPRYRAPLGGMMAVALVTLVVQIVMGGRVVLEELRVQRVVAHLLLAFLFFAILLRMTLRAQDLDRGPGEKGVVQGTRGLRAWSHAAAGLVFVQAGLGGWVSSSGAGLSCPDFPTCQGSWFPRMEGLVGIHYAHRLGAYVVFAAVLGLLIRAASAPLPPRARWPLRIAGVLVALQMLLGIGNVVLGLPLAVSAGHLATALALFGTLLVANHELARL
ncbi:MAG: heme A synthase [Candidatus Eisenbacteria bacterium]|uniref:Heme A synthase n=1 Tax=Eiseniibacteriota bacterium TaxID=2212470 RepID=A0A538T8W6_UNCEI|nr:MAG: heme A synthase [Candidatus Eisenbacteria bacterium]